MRTQYATSLKPEIIKQLKLASVEENRPANEIIENSLQNYLRVLNYDILYKALNNMMNGFSSLRINEPLTLDQFSQILGCNINKDLKNKQINEYDTIDLTLSIATDKCNVNIVLELDSNMLITHIVDVTDY